MKKQSVFVISLVFVLLLSTSVFARSQNPVAETASKLQTAMDGQVCTTTYFLLSSYERFSNDSLADRFDKKVRIRFSYADECEGFINVTDRDNNYGAILTPKRDEVEFQLEARCEKVGSEYDCILTAINCHEGPMAEYRFVSSTFVYFYYLLLILPVVFVAVFYVWKRGEEVSKKMYILPAYLGIILSFFYWYLIWALSSMMFYQDPYSHSVMDTLMPVFLMASVISAILIFISLVSKEYRKYLLLLGVLLGLIAIWPLPWIIGGLILSLF